MTAVDEKEEALGRLGDHWAGGFVLGHGMDIDVLRRAGIEDADAVVVSTDGDNTNIVIGQVAQQRFDNQCVVVRMLDPARAAVLPRARPAHDLPDVDRDRRAARVGAGLRGPARPDRRQLDGEPPGHGLRLLARDKRRHAASSVAPVPFRYERSLCPCLACFSHPRSASA